MKDASGQEDMLEIHQAVPGGVGRGLSAVVHARLGKNVGHVVGYSPGADEKLAPNRGIAMTGSDEAQHFYFSL